MARIAINGFGRIGRNILRAAIKRGAKLDVVHINDIDKPTTLAHLFKYDSVHGIFDGTVEATEDAIVVNGKKIAVTAKRDPSELPHKQHGCEVVLECSGRFTDRASAEKHIAAGAKKVIISAPAKGQDFTLAYGINHEKYDPAKHNIVSNASCTTNCFVPLAKVLHDSFGISSGFMTTIHAYTADQRLQDLPHKDLRRARAAADNIIPTSTGANRAVAEVLPELSGKFVGMAFRVPVLDVSVVDLSVELGKSATVEDINAAFEEAASGELKGILAVSHEELVSSDMKGDSHSSIVDAPLTLALGSQRAKVVSWYDNEWGFSCRMVDLITYMAARL